MKEYPVIISYFTNDWEYPKYAREMIEQCESLGLEHRIVERPTQNSYLKNCRMKPTFIKESLNILQRPVLWIDVDGCILQRPKFFTNLDADFAAKKMKKERARTWHVGTMWFNYNEKTMAFIDKWIEYTENSCSDEEGLDRYWNKENHESLITMDIPENYFIILTKHNKTPPKNSVICHRISTGADKMKSKRKKILPRL